MKELPHGPFWQEGYWFARLTRKLAQDLCETIYLGGREKLAAAIHGVPHRTYFAWKRRGRLALDGAPLDEDDLPDMSQVPENEHRYVYLYMGILAARAMREDMMHRAIQDHGTKDWRALAYLLEREEPSFYKETSGGELPGEVPDVAAIDMAIERRLEAMSDADLRGLAIDVEAREARASEADTSRLRNVHDAGVSRELAPRGASGSSGKGPVW